MKRLLSIVAMIMLVAPTFGQLQVKQQANSELVFKSQYMSLTKTGEAYDLVFTDANRTGSMIIHLGDSLAQAMLTYDQIGEWFSSAEKKASMVIAGKDGNDLTLFKQNESTWMITEGDAEYARKFFNDKMTQAFVGSKNYNSKADKIATPKISYVQPGHFKPEKKMKIFGLATEEETTEEEEY